MKDRWLLLADLHFDDKPENEYRFNLIRDLEKLVLEQDITNLAILGDLTEKKDNHSSVLVNKISNFICGITGLFKTVVLLKGNHDYIVEDVPFFKFLENYQNIIYIYDKPQLVNGGYFIPHSKTFTIDKVPKGTKFIGIHQTVQNAVANNDFKLSSTLTVDQFDKFGLPVFSGDIHKPQHLGENFEYVGSPYNIYFGDDFNGRIIIFDGKNFEEVITSFPRKYKINIDSKKCSEKYLMDLLKENDQIKVELNIEPYEKGDIDLYKTFIVHAVEQKKAILFGIEIFLIKESIPERKEDKVVFKKFDVTDKKGIFKSFIIKENIPSDIARIGEELMNEA